MVPRCTHRTICFFTDLEPTPAAGATTTAADSSNQAQAATDITAATAASAAPPPDTDPSSDAGLEKSGRSQPEAAAGHGYSAGSKGNAWRPVQNPFPAAGHARLDVPPFSNVSLPWQAAGEMPPSVPPQAGSSSAWTQPGPQSLDPASSPLQPQHGVGPVVGAAGPAGSQSQHTDSQSQHTDSQSQHTGSQSRHTGSQPRHTGSQPRHTGSQPQHTGSQPQHTLHLPHADVPCNISRSLAAGPAPSVGRRLLPVGDSQRARRGRGAMTHPFAAAGSARHPDRAPQAAAADPSLTGPEHASSPVHTRSVLHGFQVKGLQAYPTESMIAVPHSQPHLASPNCLVHLCTPAAAAAAIAVAVAALKGCNGSLLGLQLVS